jgi:CBS domain-containing protein
LLLSSLPEFSYLNGIKLTVMKKVSDILTRKGSDIVSTSPNTTVYDAIKLMAEKNIGSVLVMEGEAFLGIMTERDYCRKVILKGKSSTDTMVSEIMSVDFPAVTPADTIDQCMSLLSQNNLRYLPVYKNQQLCGILSIHDVVKQTIIAQEETITQLKDYLHAAM